MDLRARIFEAHQAGESTAEVAERFAVSPAFVRRLMQRHRQTGSWVPSSAPRAPQPRLSAHAERLRQLNAEQPDLTPAEVRQRLGLTTSVLTVWRMLRRLGLTFKKSPCTPASATAPMSNRRAPTGRRSSPPRPRDG